MLYVDGKPVGVMELRARYNLPEIKKDYVDFQLDSSQIKPDHANGGVKHSLAKEILTSFRRVDPATKQVVEISYSESAPTKDEKTQKVKYSPKRLTFEGFSQRFDATQDLEKVTYFWLTPRCGESPFRKNKDPKFFNPFYPEVVAKKQNKLDTLLGDALVFVRDAQIDDLRMKGKGLNLNLTNDMSDDEVRATVTAKAKGNPGLFLKQINDKSIVWRGRVKDAIDIGIFEKKSRNQMPCWYWAKGDRTGTEICVIDNGADPYEFLLNFMLTDWDNFYHELGRVQMKSVNEKQLQQKLENTESAGIPIQSKFRDMLQVLMNAGKIFYNPISKEVSYIKGGEVGKLITGINKDETWIDAVERAATADTKVKQGLTGMYNLSK